MTPNSLTYKSLMSEINNTYKDLDDIYKYDETYGEPTIHDLKELNELLSVSSPSDYIVYDKETYNAFNNYLIKSLEIKRDIFYQQIPNDIFVAKTIPLPDVVFKSSFGNEGSSDIHIRCVYAQDKLIIAIFRKGELGSAVIAKQDSDSTYALDGANIYIEDLNFYDKIIQDYKIEVRWVTLGVATHIFAHWYALQIMMLNPVIKERLFEKDRKEKLHVSSDYILGSEINTSKKRKAKYVKYKRITNTIIHSDILRKKHVLCWYVIGHYRHYKNGTKSWVNGYWKGPLRELQKNLDDGRERLV